MPAWSSASRVRRAQVVSLSLTELMLLLVFMAIAFSFLAKEESQREVPKLQARLDAALRETDRLEREKAELTQKLADAVQDDERLRQFLERVQIDSETLRPRGDSITIDSSHVYTLATTVARAPGHPQCSLTGRYLVRLQLLSGGQIRGTRLWDRKDASLVANLPGLAALSSGQSLSLADFGAAAKAVHEASLKSNNCVFAVETIRRTKDADLFDAELRAVERYFNVARR